MPRTAIVLLSIATWVGCARSGEPARAPDPAVSDGDKYRVVFENEQVRVLRYHDEPGARTRMHHHPGFVMIALAPFRRQLTFPDGTRKEREFGAGDAVWMPAQTHTGENIGTTNTDTLLVEVKGH